MLATRHQQHGHLDIAVAQLRLYTPLQELQVVKTGFGVDANRCVQVEADVPGTLVAEPTDGRLSGPPGSR